MIFTAEALQPGGARLAPRPRVLEQLARQLRIGGDLVVIEAQAGQGKTTTALQLMAGLQIPAAWCALGPAERDPGVFLANLYAALGQAIPDFRAPLLEDLLESGAVLSPAEHDRAVGLLLEGIRSCKTEVLLVVDDVHRLEPGGATAGLLRRLVEARADRPKLLLLSREPVLPALGITPKSVPAGFMSNNDLAFTPAEIGELFAAVLRIPIAPDGVQRLSQATEGWAMGLALVASRLETGLGLDSIPELPLDLLRGGHIPDYFRSQLLASLGAAERRDLYKLAMLDEIPAELAAELAPGLDLPRLTRHNLFLRELSGPTTVYGFHHLFHASLRQLADTELPPAHRQDVLRQAAAWYRKRGDGAAALAYLLQADDYQGADAVAHTHGLDLLARNRIATLHGLLRGLPEHVLEEFPWLGYLLGVSQLSAEPPFAYDHLDQARVRFQRDADGPGELLATAQIMYFHIAVDSEFHRLEPLLDRANALFEEHADELSIPMRVECAQYVSFANTHMDRDPARAADLSALAWRLAERHQLDNALASIACNRAYAGALRGDWSYFARCLDQVYPLQSSPRVTAFSNFLLHFTQCNLLSVSGDFFNYRLKSATMRDVVSGEVFDGTVCKSFLYVYEIDLAVSEGRIADARELVKEALATDPAPGDHMRSQYLHYSAYVAALRGDAAKSREDAAESLRLRCRVGHPYHTHINHLLVGGAFARLGDRDEALEHLRHVIAYGDRQGDQSLPPGAHLHMAWLDSLDGRRDSALASLQLGLRQMRANGYVTFFGWEPEMMKRLLSTAVAEGIEPEYARRLAAARFGTAILDDGWCVPLLDLKILGGLELRFGNSILPASELTPIQRELLLLLSAAPGGVSYDDVQLALWPAVPENKVRARLDTLVSRLRRVIADACEGTRGAAYLVMENKYLRLNNCRIDARHFGHHVRTALGHARRQEYWQANNEFRRALSYWNRPPAGGDDLLGPYFDDLRALHREAVVRHVNILCTGGETAEALDVARTAVAHAPADEVLVSVCQGLLIRKGDSGGLRRLAEAHANALRQEGASEQDVQQALEHFWSGTTAAG